MVKFRMAYDVRLQHLYEFRGPPESRDASFADVFDAAGVADPRDQEYAAVTVTQEQQFVMLLYDWLHASFDPGHRSLEKLLEAMQHALHDYEETVRYWQPQEYPTFLVRVAEGRFVSWPASLAWYDLQDRVEVQTLPVPPVTYVVCDLAALYLRFRRFCEAQHERTQDSSPPSDP